jgi:hypothetical protein
VEDCWVREESYGFGEVWAEEELDRAGEGQVVEQVDWDVGAEEAGLLKGVFVRLVGHHYRPAAVAV